MLPVVNAHARRKLEYVAITLGLVTGISLDNLLSYDST